MRPLRPDEVRRFRRFTASDWEAADARTLLDYLGWKYGKKYDRKFRLFACGCVQIGWRKLTRQASRKALRLAEDQADGVSASPDEVERIMDAARHAADRKNNPYMSLAWIICGYDTEEGYYEALAPYDFKDTELPDTVLRTVAHDIFMNPFHPVAIGPAWMSADALNLAKSMYESKDFSAMPILADALQDAGCDEQEILNHCRGPGPHFRGCWVVDMILGKGPG